MDKTATIKYILNNVENLQEFDKLNLLVQMNKRKIKIVESADGSRIWVGRLPLSELQGIASYIRTIMDRDQEHYLKV